MVYFKWIIAFYVDIWCVTHCFYMPLRAFTEQSTGQSVNCLSKKRKKREKEPKAEVLSGCLATI